MPWVEKEIAEFKSRKPQGEAQLAASVNGARQLVFQVETLAAPRLRANVMSPCRRPISEESRSIVDGTKRDPFRRFADLDVWAKSKYDPKD